MHQAAYGLHRGRPGAVAVPHDPAAVLRASVGLHGRSTTVEIEPDGAAWRASTGTSGRRTFHVAHGTGKANEESDQQSPSRTGHQPYPASESRGKLTGGFPPFSSGCIVIGTWSSAAAACTTLRARLARPSASRAGVEPLRRHPGESPPPHRRWRTRGTPGSPVRRPQPRHSPASTRVGTPSPHPSSGASWPGGRRHRPAGDRPCPVGNAADPSTGPILEVGKREPLAGGGSGAPGLVTVCPAPNAYPVPGGAVARHPARTLSIDKRPETTLARWCWAQRRGPGGWRARARRRNQHAQRAFGRYYCFTPVRPVLSLSGADS